MVDPKTVKLTKLTTKGGCAAKWGPGELRDILAPLMPGADENVLLGFETSDDAAIYKINDELCMVLTLDFLTPLVDDPYEFGKVAATNAISDVFAMGATPLCALNILALDVHLGTGVAGEILRGGADAVRAAGAVLVGGHSVDDVEPKYGLAVLGTVHPDRILRNGGAQPGDVLFLTKPLGTGVMSAARKIDAIDDSQFRQALDSMQELNRAGAEAAQACGGAHAMTDVTGFALAGHLHEMLEASDCSATIDYDALPTFEGVQELTEAYCRPGRTFNIIEYADPFIEKGSLDFVAFDNRMGVVCDPQTSGGLLVAVAPECAAAFEQAFEERAGRLPWRIGEITPGNCGKIRFSDQ